MTEDDLTPFMGAVSLETSVCFRHSVILDEIDALGHVNNAVYVRWVQDAAIAHWLAVVGPEGDPDFIWVCRRHEIDYLASLLEGDDIEIRTWLGRRSGSRFDRHTDIRKSGAPKPAAVAVTSWVLLDKASGRPRRVSDAILARFGVSLADGAG